MQIFLAKSLTLLSWCRTKLTHRNDSGANDSVASSISPAVECYACTQPGVPTFHSTTCDRAQSPEWAAGAGSSLIPIQSDDSAGDPPPLPVEQRKKKRRRQWVLDPRSPRVQRWNRGFVLARAVALALDPVFFYSVSFGGGNRAACLYMDGGLVAAATVMRTAVDVAHLAHIWLQMRMAYVSRESLVVGCGKLVWDRRMVAEHYLRSAKGFWFDLFVILPVPQIAFCMVVPRLIKEEEIKLTMTILLMIFLFQYLPKVYHIFCVMRRMQKVTGFIFGSIWWGFGLNLIAYFIASHVAGGCWYVLTIQRIASCLKQQCEKDKNCNLLSFTCSKEARNDQMCLKFNGPFRYGIYSTALPVVSSNSLAVKILYPIFWGLMTLSTFGNNLEPTSNWLEVIFSITIVLSGLMLFTLLIGNIQIAGILALGNGEEEEDAAEVQRYGVVDEEEAASFSAETESSTI
ncbi:Cyclic nucleotide-gated ion channel 2 [Platanthera guangdongensis]|uniref:Cyclic nucleotide-gated ion channel 2 n=1 Tax=Platanthera guangdongensis TaxID=2320717 RepID=A0ABR2LZL4_9ASPA